ncbi:uncharacterized protein LOC107274368 [Cephus cinctus]|uniref:Uncharacterized protein LOC107274368 n=1 Tax=Cephus cinctus TaxID=211228 RepID=A0AAJ7FUG4_CEPCN|nr:uncharacterized protein LOC107274368 [Cephus cinctus]XP_024947375.1 uncharacterized protein LOC107274368 [Cephus cinctus]
MLVIAVWASLFLAHSSRLLVAGGQQQYAHPLSGQMSVLGGMGFSDKRANMAEPSCEELRAMWRYSKRQSRAAEMTNEIPTYHDPFSYNVWESYMDRSQPSLGYRDGYAVARSRGAGGAPIYGRVIHKAPAGQRLRTGMPDRTRAFEEVTRLYGTINRHPPSPRRRMNFRVGGGSSSSLSQVPQAGSFQHLKELIRTERARELQEQRMAEEMAARAAVLKEISNGNHHSSEEDSRGHFMNSLQPYQGSKNLNFDYDQSRYVSNIASLGQALSRGDQYGRGEYMLR